MKKVVALVCLAALLLVAAAGVAWALVDGDSDSGSSARMGEPGDRWFYAQSVDWSDCGSQQCGTIEVPLDYAEPDGERIELNLRMRPASDQSGKVGHLVVNPGGPGGPGTTYAAQAVLAFGEPVLDNFDIVGFDPRGTGESAPVDCLSDDELDDYVAMDPTPDTQAEIRELRQWNLTMGEGCKSRGGAIADHVSTVEAARDIDVLRAVLGEEKLNYFGASYGTKLGATYADLFPERAGRLVLDGAMDLTLTTKELNLGQAQGFQRALDAYVENCVGAGDCYLGNTHKAALRSIEKFVAQVDRKPVPAGDRELRIGNAVYGILMPLYNQQYWTLLDSALEKAMDGDGGELLQLSDAYSSRNPGGGYGDNSAEAYWAISCQDDPAYTKWSEIPEQLDEFDKVSPVLGRSLAWDMGDCVGYRGPEPEDRGPVTAKGSDPILVVGTTRDPATPYEWAQAMAEQLDNAVLLTREGDGHTAYNMGNDCADDVIESYLIDGEVPPDDVTCD